MERGKRIEDIKPLLLKVFITLAFPIAGFIISILMSERDPPSISPPQEEHETDSHLSASQHGFDDESSSRCIDDEAEEKESEVSNSLRSPTTQEITAMERYGNPDENSIEQEVESLKSIITALEERVREFENRFHDYYCMKEEESAFQKLQIMCLGLKQESLESQNRRLEGTVAEFRAAIQGFDAMIRADNAELQQMFKRLSKINTRNSRVIRQEVSNLNAREIELSKERAEIELVMKEIKELGNQFQEERKAMQDSLKTTSKDEEAEVPIEECNIGRSSGKEETLDQLGQIRERWAGDMEEMIYIGWITACLRRELTMNQREEITRTGEDGAPSALPREKGDLMTVRAPATADVQSCCVDFDRATCAGPIEDVEEAGIDGAARSENTSAGKPRLLRKLKGWARLKGKSKSKGSCYGDDKSLSKIV